MYLITRITTHYALRAVHMVCHSPVAFQLNWCRQFSLQLLNTSFVQTLNLKFFQQLLCSVSFKPIRIYTRICAAEMAVRYAALSACRKVHT